MALKTRTDQVGSLMRPPELRRAREAHVAGGLPLEALRRLEDRAILDALEMQRQAGIEVYSDGEMRRTSWMTDFYDAVEGFSDERRLYNLPGPDGGIITEASNTRYVGGKLRQTRRIAAHQAAFLAQHAPGPFKITLPSPAYTASSFKPGLSEPAYASRAELLQDAVAIMQGELQALVAEGVSYLQLDEGFVGYLGEGRLEELRAQGIDPERQLEGDIAAENACYDALPREQLTLGMHICRGNRRGRSIVSGGYDWLAEQLFNALHVDRFLLEYDSERAGGFEPLRFVPKGKLVVLGLISTKTPELEKRDDLLRRIDEASKYLPIEQLALSPQCGFNGAEQGDLMSMDDQWRKLELVVETARNVWS